MRDDEETNPRMLKQYVPWWFQPNGLFLVDKEWKVKELRVEAERRNLLITGTKDELIERINNSSYKYNLSNDNFHAPTYTEVDRTKIPKCYPEVYDK